MIAGADAWVPALPADLDTPAVVVYADRLEANIARLQAELDRRGVRLRPHVKTHKSVRIGRMQLDAGAHGLTVGTLGEAEVFAAAGIEDLFIAYPVWAAGPKVTRLRDLVERVPGLIVGVDSADGAERLAAAAGSGLRVRVELDSGGRRTGLRTPDAALAVARVAQDRGLVVDGVFTHGGHGYRPGARASAAADEVDALEAAATALEADGFELDAISAGSTPTMTDAATGRVNEIRAGTYALGDRQQWQLGAIDAEGMATVVASTVVSVSVDSVVLDAGAKALTKDRAETLDGFGYLPAWPAALVERLYDYHAVVRFPAKDRRPAVGDRVAIVPNHVCPVVDLVDGFAMVQPDGRWERWPVDARGRSG
ncbi:MAG TPA: alanine racemase [Candidatus Limnocylindrales bacterium]